MMIKSAVVTGATSMIGRSLIQYLLMKDIRVLAICHQNSTRKVQFPEHKALTICYADLDQYRTLQVEGAYDAMFHLAWAGTYGAKRNEASLQAKNIEYTLDALTLAKDLKCHTFVGAGSQAEYGPLKGKIDSQTKPNPQTGYGIAKYTAGMLSALMAKQLGIKHIWCRILSVYGPGDQANTMISSTIRHLLKGEKTAFTPARQMWDYLYVDDAARGLYLMAEKGKDQKVYPLASGVSQPLVNYLELMKAIIAPTAELGIGKLPYVEGQVMYLGANLQELEEDTGFRSSITFEEGIRRTIDAIKREENDD